VIYRVFIEETASRLFYRDVDAASPAEANALAATAIESDAWTEWAETDTSASLEVREELTGVPR
jgi:hypothetical protein